MSNKRYREISPKSSLPEIEKEVLKFWQDNNIFEKSLENRKDAKRYSFYDGPPFATGTPHYGHIIASTLKDVVPRYFTMKGYFVERRWGWDCHGLPIENIAEKELGIKQKKDILEYGVKKFNDFCRSKVLEYTDNWKKVITRLGRWADMDNAYKTMDLPYMESVWAVFKNLHNQGLIYEGYRSMHICPRCETTLSQSEVAEGYKMVKDLSVIAKFELVDEPRTYVLAWTTTPWTLLGNVALAINDNIKYVKIKLSPTSHSSVVPASSSVVPASSSVIPASSSVIPAQAGIQDDKKDSHFHGNDKFYFILAKDRVKEVFKDQGYEVIEEFSGKELVGKKYKPLFEFPRQSASLPRSSALIPRESAIFPGKFVNTEEGTGIVHIAPAFGEDDLNLSKEFNLPLIQHIGMDGIIKSEFGEFSGLSVKPLEDIQSTDVAIIKYLAKKELLFDKAQYEHSYPHCWRCETPLINYATSSWFVAVERLKAEALELAKDISWTPKHIKNGRFGKWLQGARDWAISRQRFWASAIPIWRCTGDAGVSSPESEVQSLNQNSKSCDNLVVIGSVQELEELSGEKITDIHKHIVDGIVFKCEKCAGTMHRVPDVLDTWFDSGSMPYAELHYPFENKEKFKKSFPADFIAEGADQTRAWFYYLHLLSTATQQNIAFKNVIVNGIVLAEDGKKMSKRLQNYPDPMEMFKKYGADAVRFYLMSSPVVAAENLNFSEKEVAEISRGMFRMLLNSYSFFVLYANIDGFAPSESKSDNVLDRWIMAELQLLAGEANKSMLEYNLLKTSRLFPIFIDNLSNWYIRRSRKRFWKSENDEDKQCAYQTLHTVLVTLSKLMAPFTPFITEDIYKNLTGKESVHLEDYPKVNESFSDEQLISDMSEVRQIVEQSLAARNKAGIKVRQPLAELFYSGKRLDQSLEEIISDEVNVKKITNKPTNAKDLVVELDTNLTPKLILEGEMREIVRQLQQARKDADFLVNDRITISFEKKVKIVEVVQVYKDIIKKETLASAVSFGQPSNFDFNGQIKFEGESVCFWLKRE